MPSGSAPPLLTPFEEDAPSAPSRNGSDSSSPVPLQDRTVSIPERRDARRVDRQGRLGSQRTTREQFNTAVCKAGGVEVMQDNPLSRSKARRICSRARGVLCNSLKVPKGRYTYKELKDMVDLQQARRLLEKCFPILSLAENQWAADGFLQETLRNDRRRRSGGPTPLTDNDERPTGSPESSSLGDDDLLHTKSDSVRGLTRLRSHATAPTVSGAIQKNRSRRIRSL